MRTYSIPRMSSLRRTWEIGLQKRVDAVFRQAVINALDGLAGCKSSYLLNPEALQ